MPSGSGIPFEVVNPAVGAWLNFRLGFYKECSEFCDNIISHDDEESLGWTIKVAALTEEARIIDEDLAEMTISEEIFSEQEMQKLARPGTSLKTAKKAEKSGYNPNSASVRPQTGSGPMTGYARPGTSTRPGTGRLTTADGLKTGRVKTAQRPLTNHGRNIQTAMLDPVDGPFVKISRLNILECAKNSTKAKIIFEHITIVLGDYRTALALAEEAANLHQVDIFWHYAQATSYLKLGMSRNSEEFAKRYINETIHPDGPMLLSAIYKRLDQPLAARQSLKEGLDRNPDDVTLLCCHARLEQVRQDHDKGEAIYREILGKDPVNQEAVCVLAASSYYNDDIVRSFSLYRRALQIGPPSAALFNNLGQASIGIGQVDLGFRCLTRALQEATDDEDLELVWYNIGTACISVGEFQLAQESYKISSVYGNGGYALNNMAVLSALLDKSTTVASTLLAQANDIDASWEAQWNSALLAHERGDLQTAFHKASSAMELNPEEKRNNDFMRDLRAKFHLI